MFVHSCRGFEYFSEMKKETNCMFIRFIKEAHGFLGTLNFVQVLKNIRYNKCNKLSI